MSMRNHDPAALEYLRTHRVNCPRCGHSLAGSSTGICPECGCQFTRSALVERQFLRYCGNMGLWWITAGVNAAVFVATRWMFVDRSSWPVDRQAIARLFLGPSGSRPRLGLVHWGLILALGVWCFAVSRVRPGRWFAVATWVLTIVHVMCAILLVS